MCQLVNDQFAGVPMMRNYKDNVIVKMSFEFAIEIVEFTELLYTEKRFVFANQVLRSGCSIGANVREAQGSESKADFVHKMKIALKEAEKTEYRLELCDVAKNFLKPGRLVTDIESILKILNKIIQLQKTVKNRLRDWHFGTLIIGILSH